MNLDDADGPDVPLTERQAAIVAEMRAVLDAEDPMPPGLVDRVRFGIDLDPVDVEVSRLVAIPESARSDEYARTVTFQSDSLAIMITVGPEVDGTVRIDGWLAPSACRRVELRCTEGERSTASDDTGRFAIEAVPAGTVRFLVHDPSGSRRVITPTIEI